MEDQEYAVGVLVFIVVVCVTGWFFCRKFNADVRAARAQEKIAETLAFLACPPNEVCIMSNRQQEDFAVVMTTSPGAGIHFEVVARFGR